MEAILGRVSLTVLLTAGLVLYGVWKTCFQSSSLPDLPIIGHDETQWFAWPRTLYRSYFNYRQLYDEAYKKYGSKGLACIMPEPNDTKVVLPSSLSQWLSEQPDRVISSALRVQDFLQTDHTFPSPKMAKYPHHVQVVKRDLTRKLNTLSDEIWDELDKSFEVYWGKETEEWKEVNIMETMMRIVTRTANRLFVGKEACSDERYLALCRSYAEDVPMGSIFIRLFPDFLRPILAPLITLPNRYHVRQIRALLRPEIERRLELYDSGKEAPNDFLQWFVTYAREKLEPEESTPKFIADRIAVINFAAIHTSSFSVVNTILDIVTSPEKDSILGEVKTEIEEVLAEDHGEWTTSSVQRMVKVDSILRESMRYSTFMTGALQRCIMAKEGVTTPDGLHLKCGTMVEIPARPKHLDTSLCPDADKFVPFRYVASKENGTNGKAETGGPALSMVDTSHDFLNFSHGRHACPGRYFAANELKMLLAYMALHYDVEPLLMEPKAMAFGSFFVPNPKLSLKIRRKKSVQS